jgi:chemotaxis protein histidine kinase CheA
MDTTYLSLFISAARDHISNARKAMQIEHENISRAIVESLHREMHSLKGEAYVMQFTHFGDLALLLERYFKGLLETHILISESDSSQILSALALLEKSLENIEKSHEEIDLTPDIAALQGGLRITKS